jgi:3-hydroxymyristoyl/3-hydroxydecanoyl-(acyl carrier protein) dehydratase
MSLNPIMIRKYPAREVFLLIKRLTDYNNKSDKEKNISNNGEVIRRKAGDNWF